MKNNVRIKVDFSHALEKIKALHGINNSPIRLNSTLPELTDAGIPYCRLHDTAGMWGGAHYVDIPNVFPDFNADPEDPASYDFAFTDAYLKTLADSGIEPFYRLGVTIENYYKIKAYRIAPPSDYDKWAAICAGIVRHYNEGWADGMKLGITYWEVWNEPENPPMWSGTMQEYFDLYAVTARRLKKEFPNIKVGGYAGCGFYSINREDKKTDEFYSSFLTWYDEFLKFVKANDLPFDFYSWHLYTYDPREIVLHANYVDARLKEYGFTGVENIFNEWNCMNSSHGNAFVTMKGPVGASFVAAAFCLMQKSPIDKAMYYDAMPTRAYCGLYHFPSMEVTHTYCSFKAFNQLYKLGTAAETVVSGSESEFITALAATDGTKGALLLANFEREGVLASLEVQEQPTACFLIDEKNVFKQIGIDDPENIILPGYSVALVCFGGAENDIPGYEKQQEKIKFAGLG